MSEKKVYQAIAEVMAKLSKEGIAKDSKNVQQGYNFRGIDAVYNALAPFLAESKLCILPNVQSRDVVERQTKSGGTLFYVTVKVDFAFVSAEDGPEHHVITFGEAMDSGDKATNKAMSAAYKYACMQAFCIPTEGDNDADSTTHAVAPRTITPTTGLWEQLTDRQRSALTDLALVMQEACDSADYGAAYELLDNAGIDTDERAALTTRFDSKTRSAMTKWRKANPSQLKEAA